MEKRKCFWLEARSFSCPARPLAPAKVFTEEPPRERGNGWASRVSNGTARSLGSPEQPKLEPTAAATLPQKYIWIKILKAWFAMPLECFQGKNTRGFKVWTRTLFPGSLAEKFTLRATPLRPLCGQ